MSFNNNSSTDLSRYSIGEMQDLSGVAEFYNAGSSKWLKSATATASSNLSTIAKTSLANAGTATIQTVLAQSTLSLSYNTAGYYASYPIARISASSVSVVPAYYTASYAVGVGVMTSAGMQTVATGQTSLTYNDYNTGTNGVVASNNTTIFSYTFSSATALSAYYTTNGTTWTAGTVTGIPVFAADASTVAHASSASGDSYGVASVQGWLRNSYAAQNQIAVFWCGARFVLIAPAATNFMVSLSTDGLAWSGDNTTAVLGGTAQAKTTDMQFYRNGNSCYLNVGTAYRYTTDGGVTWAACTFAAAPNPNNYTMQYNTTDPAKLIIVSSLGATTAYYTADSGATWSANRTLPSNSNGGLWYKGSTAVSSNGQTTYYVSTNDGVTWTVPTFPIGVLSTNIKFYADANRFYGGVNAQTQILTSSDAVTWTIVTLPQQHRLSTIGTSSGYGILSFDSNTVVLLGYNSASGTNQCLFTLDGGVTWTGSQYTVAGVGGSWGVGNAFVTPDAGGVGFAFSMDGLTTGNNTAILKSDITGGGAFYRTGATAITPLRTNAFSYVRVD
jgi:hypothetical protein